MLLPQGQTDDSYGLGCLLQLHRHSQPYKACVCLPSMLSCLTGGSACQADIPSCLTDLPGGYFALPYRLSVRPVCAAAD